MAATKKKPTPTKAAFEKSGMDVDKGFKEGSKADKKADKAQFAKFKKGKGK